MTTVAVDCRYGLPTSVPSAGEQPVLAAPLGSCETPTKPPTAASVMQRFVIPFAAAIALSRAGAQQPDPGLLSAIRAIKAIDNHSHPPALTSPGQKDDDFDA